MTAPTLGQIARGYLVLPHAVPIIVVLAATAGFAVVADGGGPGLGPLAALLGAMFGGQLAIGAVNELVDAELDAVAKPTKPIPAGLVSRRGAGVVIIVGLGLMTGLGLAFGPAAFALLALGTGVGVAYSFWFKRTIWAWIPYLIALPLLPIWVWAALSTVPPGLLAIYPIGAPAVIAVQIAQSLPDVAVDREAGVRTLAAVLGTGRARWLCWGGIGLAGALAAALAGRLTSQPAAVWVAAVAATGLVGLNAAIWARSARAGALACFPCIAAAAVLLGLGWAVALFSQ